MDEINVLFNKARLLKYYPDVRDRYLNLIKKYLPYLRYITKDDYEYIIKNEYTLISECLCNIPSIKGDIRTILINFK